MSFKILWQWEPHKHSGNIKKKKGGLKPSLHPLSEWLYGVRYIIFDSFE